MAFRMQLASPEPEGGPYVPLCFETLRRGDAIADRPFNPVLAATVGAELEYGNLFAYLFRRFGSPNRRWDHAAELARYQLTTPHPSLFLTVSPRVDGRSDLSIEFLAPEAVEKAAVAFVRDELDAWWARAIAHRAAHGMPRWLHARARSIGRQAADNQAEAAHPWQIWCDVLQVRPSDSESQTRQMQAFFRRCEAAYTSVEAPPAVKSRAMRVKDWSDADPLKPFALAAMRALSGLTREVRLGADAIDVFGPKPRTSRALAGAAPTSFVFGGSLRRHDVRMRVLLQHLDELEEGELREGLVQAIVALREARRLGANDKTSRMGARVGR